MKQPQHRLFSNCFQLSISKNTACVLKNSDEQPNTLVPSLLLAETVTWGECWEGENPVWVIYVGLRGMPRAAHGARVSQQGPWESATEQGIAGKVPDRLGEYCR